MNEPILNATALTGTISISGPRGKDGISPEASVSKSGNVSTLTVTDANGTTSTQILDGNNLVSVSPTGTATDEVKYITIDGVEKKLAGSEGSEVTVSSTGTSTNEVKYITIDGVESKIAGENAVEDVQVNGSSILVNKVANI